MQEFQLQAVLMDYEEECRICTFGNARLKRLKETEKDDLD